MDGYFPLLPVAVYGLGFLLALIDRGSQGKVAHGTALAGSLAGIAVAGRALLAGGAGSVAALPIVPFASLSLRLDPLAAYFLLVVSILGIAASLYAVGYLAGDHGYSPWLGAAFNGFLATMVLVVLADSVFAFLFAWEAMSLVSFFLVIHHHHQATVRRAGYIYLVMTHASAVFLFVAFFILFAAAGGQEFDALRVAAAKLSSEQRDLVFLLALVAFATKGGVVPLHVWLPRAHPAAPSHVSALMSGVMIKMAIYGLLRFGWDLLGPGSDWWGGLLLAMGVASAVLGVLYALMERDLKRLLAYCSVENIGIILVGLGTAFLLSSRGQEAAAALALFAGLYHVLNHAVIKGLLFFGAGAVQQATHTRDLEALGGLARRMPWTSAGFLVGAAAIAALPPLNGFASEWSTFQSLVALASVGAGPVETVAAAASAGLLALASGLGAFCFVKAFGITFLGMPRSASAEAAREVSRPMLWGMGLLALLCFGLGLFPTLATGLLAPVTAALVGIAVQPPLGLAPLDGGGRGAVLAPPVLAALLLALGGLALLLGRLMGGPGRTRVSAPWGCGGTLEPSMQYSATALTKPVRIIFQTLVRPYREVERQHHPGLSYFVSGVRYEAGVRPVYEHYLYVPPVRWLMAAAHRIRQLQNGSLRTYLAYLCAALVVVLLLTR